MKCTIITDTFPLLQPVISSDTPSESKSKLCMVTAWFLDCKEIILFSHYRPNAYFHYTEVPNDIWAQYHVSSPWFSRNGLTSHIHQQFRLQVHIQICCLALDIGMLLPVDKCWLFLPSKWIIAVASSCLVRITLKDTNLGFSHFRYYFIFPKYSNVKIFWSND